MILAVRDGRDRVDERHRVEIVGKAEFPLIESPSPSCFPARQIRQSVAIVFTSRRFSLPCRGLQCCARSASMLMAISLRERSDPLESIVG